MSTPHFNDGLLGAERHAIVGLGLIFMLRMLGLFMVLPVFSLYGGEIPEATPMLIGMAIGAYGLMQAIFQIPFGLLSDRFGRKRMIILGLMLFAGGGIIAATATNIYGVIAGRALQGAGAIASVIMALVADLTREDQRTKAMAAIGMSVGSSFIIALVIGPWLVTVVGLRGLFWVSSGMAVISLLVLLLVVPTPVARATRVAPGLPNQLRTALLNPELFRLNMGIFTLHFVMTAGFMVFPHLLLDIGGVSVRYHGAVYLPLMIVSFIAMVPLIILAEKKRRIRRVYLLAILVLGGSQGMLQVSYLHWSSLLVGLFVFFFAFNLLEALLPSLVSKIAPAGYKGIAMGAFSSSQFLGAFLGAVAGETLYDGGSTRLVFLTGMGLVAVWLLLAGTMKKPRFLETRVLDTSAWPGVTSTALVSELLELEGVEEAVVVEKDQVVFLKVDKDRFQEFALEALREQHLAGC